MDCKTSINAFKMYRETSSLVSVLVLHTTSVISLIL